MVDNGFLVVYETHHLLVVSFKLYDMDHDGYLTQAELERVMTQLVRDLPALGMKKKKFLNQPMRTN
jgi:Ca2+-binding EF-hand superfamily protein